MAHAVGLPALPRSRRADDSWHGLDGPRIAANAGAITMNAVALLLLLTPATLPPPVALAERDPEITWLRPKLEPAPPPAPAPVPVLTRPEPRPRLQPAATPPRPAPESSARPAVDSLAGDEGLAAGHTDADSGADADHAVDIAPPPAGSTVLQAVAAPSPRYPAEAIRSGLSGTVELEILVSVDGKPLEVRVVRSSGHRLLDQAARRAVLSHWRFLPAMRDGLPVQALGRVPIAFTLGR